MGELSLGVAGVLKDPSHALDLDSHLGGQAYCEVGPSRRGWAATRELGVPLNMVLDRCWLTALAASTWAALVAQSTEMLKQYNAPIPQSWPSRQAASHRPPSTKFLAPTTRSPPIPTSCRTSSPTRPGQAAELGVVL